MLNQKQSLNSGLLHLKVLPTVLRWGIAVDRIKRESRVAKIILVVVLPFLAALQLAGCETVEGPPSGPTYLETHNLQSVTVTFQESYPPIHVAEIETNFRQSKLGTPELSRLGQRFSDEYQANKTRDLFVKINEHLIPHLNHQLSPKFTGTKPARAEIVVHNVFLRSRLNLAALTDTIVTINGVRSPRNNQVVAGLRLYDAETGLSLQNFSGVQVIEENGFTFGQGKQPEFGQSKRLSRLAFQWAAIMTNAVVRNAGVPSGEIDGNDGRITSF